MIPIGDARRRFRFPWMTGLLVFLVVVIFVYERRLPSLPWRYGVIPQDLTRLLPIQMLGRSLAYVLVQGPGFFVPLVNLVYFWVLGSKVEDACGAMGFLQACMFSAVGGIAFVALLKPQGSEPVYGLSAVVAGLLGAYFVLYRMAPLRAWFPILILVQAPVPAFLHLLYWFALVFVRVNVTAIREKAFTQVLSLQPDWPLAGALLVGLLAGYLFARPIFLYYNQLAAAEKG
ncbi:MAG: rhomboid family intramembrane serine protease [Chloroflexia bacterium]|nr:rhomboid family intramembrane serine protease [Chloroflexia bacterium]